jgi:hypothetical protein
MITMGDVQRHVHYERTPFARKLFYVGLGMAAYWFMFAGGCHKAKSLCANAMENPPEQIRQMQSAYCNLVGKNDPYAWKTTIDEKVR